MFSVTHGLYRIRTVVLKLMKIPTQGHLCLFCLETSYLGVGYKLTLDVALSCSHLDNQFLEGSMSHLSCLLPQEVLSHCSLLTDSLFLFKLLCYN